MVFWGRRIYFGTEFLGAFCTATISRHPIENSKMDSRRSLGFNFNLCTRDILCAGVDYVGAWSRRNRVVVFSREAQIEVSKHRDDCWFYFFTLGLVPHERICQAIDRSVSTRWHHRRHYGLALPGQPGLLAGHPCATERRHQDL